LGEQRNQIAPDSFHLCNLYHPTHALLPTASSSLHRPFGRQSAYRREMTNLFDVWAEKVAVSAEVVGNILGKRSISVSVREQRVL